MSLWKIFIFETYCRIHQCIDIGMLSQKLNMNYDDAERWIVNLIRNARLDAKIDSKMGTVVMGTQHPNMYVKFLFVQKYCIGLSGSLFDHALY
jgi:translation initiation factor 3 subunit E